jgi:hypothetical protein
MFFFFLNKPKLFIFDLNLKIMNDLTPEDVLYWEERGIYLVNHNSNNNYQMDDSSDESSNGMNIHEYSNAEKLRMKRASMAKKHGRPIGHNGRPCICDEESSEAINKIIVRDAEQGIFHNASWLQVLV